MSKPFPGWKWNAEATSRVWRGWHVTTYEAVAQRSRHAEHLARLRWSAVMARPPEARKMLSVDGHATEATALAALWRLAHGLKEVRDE